MESFITRVLFMPPSAAEHGAELDALMFYVHVLMFLLFVGWSAFFLYTLWRFNAKRQARADHHGVRSHMSSYLEVGVAIVEGVLLVGFAIPLWARGASLSNYPPEADSTVVRIIGRQFNWIARYPGADGVFGKGDVRFVTQANPLGADPVDPAGKDDILIQTSEVVVPVNKPVIAHISSLDVIHSFAVKTMRVTQDAIPGLSIPVWFTPTHTGNYLITCAQLCGNGHSSMRGVLRVVTPEEYESFLKSQAGQGVDSASYE